MANPIRPELFKVEVNQEDNMTALYGLWVLESGTWLYHTYGGGPMVFFRRDDAEDRAEEEKADFGPIVVRRIDVAGCEPIGLSGWSAN